MGVLQSSMTHSSFQIASFPGPAQLSIAMKSLVGPGNKARFKHSDNVQAVNQNYQSVNWLLIYDTS